MRDPAKHLIPLMLAFVLATPACISGGELGPIGQPLPMGTPFASEFDLPSGQAAPAVRLGTSQQVGSLTLVAKNVVRPANHIADDATFYIQPESGQEYVAVEISATCNLPAEEACFLSSADFGASGAQGATYFGQLVTSGIGRAFEGGELKGGKSRSGYLFFLVSRDDSALVMQYPSSVIGSIGPKALFVIEE
jgi:hypothetical protein